MGDGNTALFHQNKSGSYVSRGQSVVGTRNPGGTFTFLWPDLTEWNFKQLSGSPAQSRISSIADSNGNKISFVYNGSGQLKKVFDTLGRQYLLTHTAEGRIASLTDFAGRVVSYSYYQDSDPGGSDGDLASMTSPAVTGTPTGNDFPFGKTTEYTYSEDFADDSLNHNLLTVTNPRGETWMVNEYAGETDSRVLGYDRVIRQQLGEPGQDFHFHYADLTPRRRSTQPGKVIPHGPRRTLAIANDPRGAVRELLYDERDLLIELREYTGFADPAQVTTLTTNRPTGKLRSSDPKLYRTVFEYSEHDGLVRTITDPEGNRTSFVYQVDVTPGGPRARAGNLRELRSEPGPRGADQTSLSHLFEYSSLHNQLTSYTCPGGDVTTLEYDVAGNCTRAILAEPGVEHDFEYDANGRLTAHVLPDDGTGHRRRDEYNYYVVGPSKGYLSSIVKDFGGLAITRSFNLNNRGLITASTNERGYTSLFIVNQLDQVVRWRSPVIAAAGALRYRLDTYFDANDFRTRVETVNRDETGALLPNPSNRTTWGADYLNQVVDITREVDAGTDGTIEYEYEAPGLLTLVRSDNAVSGTQPANVLRIENDERGLVYRLIRAESDPDQSTTEWSYDRNGNPVKSRTGLESGARTSRFSYDGYDRLVSVTDAMGNQLGHTWDACGLAETALQGEVNDVPGQAGNTLLERTVFTRDGLGRVVTLACDFFETSTGSPIGTGVSEWNLVWDGLGGLVGLTDPASNTTTRAYDTAHRLDLVTDAGGNTIQFVRDPAGNVTSVTESHVRDGGGPNVDYTWTAVYDELDRRVQSTNPAGDMETRAYDSHSRPAVITEGRGNVTRFSYDGIDRITQRKDELTATGSGGGALVSERIIDFAYDFDHGLTAVTDDDGNQTSYTYDALNRLVQVDFADLTTSTVSYDAHDDAVSTTDQNGTVVMRTYDALGREVSRAITPGAGVSSDTTSVLTSWDGRGLVRAASDDDSSVVFDRDSLGRVLEEDVTVQATGGPVARSVATSRDGIGSVASLTYPGGRTIDYTQDGLGRVKTIVESATTHVTNDYVGPGEALETRSHSNGTTTSMTYDPAGRPQTATTSDGIGTIVDRGMSWDASGDPVSRDNLLAGGTMFAFEVDSLGRLVMSIETPWAGPMVNVQYALDDSHNRTSVTGGSNPGVYTRDATNPPGDSQRHQYTSTPFDDRTYDANGNLASRDPLGAPPPDSFDYDYANRLVQYTDGASGLVTEYAYDALGRRTQRILDALGTPQETLFFHAGGHLIEETDGGGGTTATYVWSSRGFEPEGELRDPVSVVRGGTTSVFHLDPQGSVAAASDSVGSLAEQYEYGPFGELRISDGQGTPLSASAIGNPILFRSDAFAPETGFYSRGAELFEVEIGRWNGPILASRTGAGIQNELASAAVEGKAVAMDALLGISTNRNLAAQFDPRGPATVPASAGTRTSGAANPLPLLEALWGTTMQRASERITPRLGWATIDRPWGLELAPGRSALRSPGVWALIAGPDPVRDVHPGIFRSGSHGPSY